MAHVGVIYPVHWRRDIALNLTNYRVAYGRAYSVTVDGKSGSLGLAMQGVPFYAHAQDETTFTFARWQDAYKSFHGRDIRWEGLISATGPEIGTGATWTLRDRLLGPLAVYKPFLGQLHAYQELPSTLVDGSLSHPELYNDTVTLRIIPDAVKWETYHHIYG